MILSRMSRLEWKLANLRASCGVLFSRRATTKAAVKQSPAPVSTVQKLKESALHLWYPPLQLQELQIVESFPFLKNDRQMNRGCRDDLRETRMDPWEPILTKTFPIPYSNSALDASSAVLSFEIEIPVSLSNSVSFGEKIDR